MITCEQPASITVTASCSSTPTLDTTIFIPGEAPQPVAYRYGGGIHALIGDLLSGNVQIYNSTTNWSQDASNNLGPNLGAAQGAYSKLADRLLLTVQRTTDLEVFLYLFQITVVLGVYTLSNTNVDLQNLTNSAGTSVLSVVCDDNNGFAYVLCSAKLIAVNTLTQAVTNYSPAVTAGYAYTGQAGYNPSLRRTYGIRNGPSSVIDVFGSDCSLLTSLNLPNTGNNVVFNTDDGALYVAGNDGGSDGGFVIWVLDTSGTLLTTIRFPVANSVFRWAHFMLYVSATHHIYLPFLDQTGTARGLWVVCAATRTSQGIVNASSEPPLQSAYADNVKRLLLVTQNADAHVFLYP